MPLTDFDYAVFFEGGEYKFGLFDEYFNLLDGSAAWLNQIGIKSEELPIPLSEVMLEPDFAYLKEYCAREELQLHSADELVRIFSKGKELFVYRGQLRKIDGRYHFMLRDMTDEQRQLEMFQHLSQNARIAAFSYDPQLDKAYWTDRLHEIYGIPKGSLITQNTFNQHIHKEDYPRFKQASDRLYAEHIPYSIKVRMITDRGKIRHIKMFAEPHVQHGEVVLVTGYSQDVTGQERKLAKIKRDKELIELAIRGIRSGIFDHDLERDMIHYGPYFSEVIGLDGLMKEEDFRARIHPEDREAAHKRHLEGLEKPGNHYFNFYRLRNKMGTYRQYEVHAWRSKNKSGKSVRMVGNLIDVDEKYVYEKKLKEFNGRLYAMVNNGFVSMVLLDLDGAIILADKEANDLIVEQYGRNPQLERVLFKEALTILEADQFEMEFAKAKNGISIRKEVVHTFNDGTEKWYDFMYTPIYGSEGTVQNVLLKYLDITAIKKSELSARDAQERAEELNVMKSNFLANMSHEIRTPLNGILSVVELLPLAENGEELEQLIEIQRESGQRLLDTLTGIINLSLLEAERSSLKLTEEHISELARLTYQSFVRQAQKKGLSFTFQKHFEEEVVVSVDREMLIAALKNVVHNAIKFTDKGKVEVHLEKHPKEQLVQFRVVDTGIGIESSKLDRIFMSFTQGSEGLSRNFEGTGIGLSLTKKYLSLLGGHIDLKSEPGKGSEFIIFIPCHL